MDERLKPELPEPYYLPTGNEVGIVEQCHAGGLAVMLKGPTGCGKTRLVKHMAWRPGRPLITVSCHDDLAECRRLGPMPLYRDWWTGELRAATAARAQVVDGQTFGLGEPAEEVRSARMERRPEQREAIEDEDKPGDPGIWMIQQDAPHEVAEDPFGLQRPVDRDDETSAEEYGDMLSELASTRMVAAPEPPCEVLLSDDPPASRAVLDFKDQVEGGAWYRYPEWNHADASCIEEATTVRMLPRGWLREGLYEARGPGRRSIAVSLLVDASGSTDGFIGDGRRVIDVEREALLLVCVALQGLGEPFSVNAFSGEGPHGVSMRMLKGFDEPYGPEVALRIAGLEPEHYTRAGTAIRHASAMLMRQPAEHRLLLVLSDGKPNDADRYDGCFGVEDMRQSVTEACLQDNYAVLSTPERLPLVLLDWTRRLLAR